MNRFACAATVCFLSCITPAIDARAQEETKAPAAAGTMWTGSITLPGGAKLDFSVNLTGSSGTIDIPMQGASGLALTDITADDTTLKFTLKPPGAPEASWARFDAKIDADGKTATGQLHQGGADMPLSMKKAAPGETAKKTNRPQLPKPPFPYQQREVSYTNAADGTKLAGTLTFPSGAGPFPAVVMITGSGPQDRDESLLGHKPFLVIADHLSRNGFAVLRADDRGVGGSTGKTSGSTSADFAGDALAGVEFLRTQPEIDAKRIGLIGHSEGGLIAPMAAAKDEGIAFIVLLAGTGLPGRDILRLQVGDISRADGTKEAEVQDQLKVQDEILDLIAKGADTDTVKAKVRKVAEHQIQTGLASEDAADREKAQAAKDTIEQLVESETKQMTSPWFRYFVTLDPRESLKKTKCPVLALNGEKDLQVSAKANLPEIEKALREGGNHDVAIMELPGLNHLFQSCTTGSPSEYAAIEETMSPRMLEIMTTWLQQHAQPRSSAPASQ